MTKNAQEVLGWIQTQTQAYRQMAELGRDQNPEGSMDGERLIELVTQKSQILTQVDEIETHLGPIKQNWGGFLDSIDPAHHASLREAMETLRSTLRELVEQELGQQNELKEKMNSVSGHIKQTIQGQKAGKAYQSRPQSPNNRFMDKKG